MQQYFLNDDNFTKNDVHHIVNVMRCNTGDKVIVVKNSCKYIATLSIQNKEVEITELKDFNENNELDHKLIMAVGLLKGDKFDWVVQKCAELGVSKLIPMKLIRNIVKLDGKEDKKVERWNKISKEACEQSKRNNIMEVIKPLSIKELEQFNEYDKFVCYESKEGSSLMNELKGDSLIVIGPEGGLEKAEIELLQDINFKVVTLSKQILRAETAAIFAASVCNGKWGI